jgi:hypothetical protein
MGSFCHVFYYLVIASRQDIQPGVNGGQLATARYPAAVATIRWVPGPRCRRLHAVECPPVSSPPLKKTQNGHGWTCCSKKMRGSQSDVVAKVAVSFWGFVAPEVRAGNPVSRAKWANRTCKKYEHHLPSACVPLVASFTIHLPNLSVNIKHPKDHA